MSYIALIKGNELSIFCLTQGLGFEGVGGTALHKLILGPPPPPQGKEFVQGDGGGLLALMVSLVIVGKEEGSQSRMPLSLQ